MNNNVFFLKLNTNNEFRQLGPAILSFGRRFCNSVPKHFVFLLAYCSLTPSPDCNLIGSSVFVADATGDLLLEACD